VKYVTISGFYATGMQGDWVNLGKDKMNQNSSLQTRRFSNSEKDIQRQKNISTENTRGIENDILAVEYFAGASKLHYEAARFHEARDHNKASDSTIKTLDFSRKAHLYQMYGIIDHSAEA
jgi:hypothetical protein